ncbi:kinase-like domain-containing protein [Diplogelasinospora grovesii]|uniref:non-specific serine/threonine protein kinase n=1 Tax=Diplogelasinospora grovesii TaxID=303347 RepID=A0AAN6NCC1_9PEZI|nr:kinase-like domain-containing protein [Diplogelasinospora grovesii]
MKILINERYRLDYKIGQGGFGSVYSGTDLQSGDEVAIKLRDPRITPYDVEDEALAYGALSRGVGIPRLRWSGRETSGDCYALVQDVLGPSLEDLFKYCGGRFSLKTVLLIADQALSRLQYIQSNGIVHRDIKPDNLLMGVGKQGNLLYIIDFGLAELYEEFQGLEDREGLPFLGTDRYASLNSHNGRQQSWRDDLESLGYSLVYFARGSLPWQGLNGAAGDERHQLIKEKKMSTSVEELCEGLPNEFATYINYVRSLGFDEKPDYVYLRRLFRRLFRSKGFKYDNVFDWTEKRFKEVRGELDQPKSARRRRPTKAPRPNQGVRHSSRLLDIAKRRRRPQ